MRFDPALTGRLLPAALAVALSTGLAACGGGAAAPSAADRSTAPPATTAVATTTPPVAPASPSARPRKAHRPRPVVTSPKPVPATTAPRPASSPPRPSPSPTVSSRPTVPISTATAPPSSRDYRFPVVGCSVSYGSSHHDYPATDVFAAQGCAFVAVVSGTVDEVSSSDHWDPKINDGATRGGLSVSIVGADGVRYYGSHLSAIASGIAPGAHVHAGQLLGRVGKTGDAKYVGTHVHFGISWPTRAGVWWVRRGMVSPYAYLSSWRSGGDMSPRSAVAAAHARYGDVPPCRADC
ncbi:MAG: M23 family metallopeptidase [Frankiaceae bacterium]